LQAGCYFDPVLCVLEHVVYCADGLYKTYHAVS